MTTREKNKWAEKHFQICLAIIGRTEVDAYGFTKPLNMDDVIKEADVFIKKLQQRSEGYSTADELLEKVAK